MARLTNAIITQAGRLGSEPESSIANLPAGAQLGVGPHYPELDAATPLALPPLVPIVMHTPTMFDGVPYFNEMLKVIIERMPQSISGVDIEYTLEANQSVLGHDGQPLNMPTQSRLSPITPQFTWKEGTGNIIFNIHEKWIRSIRDPDTQATNLGLLLAGNALTTPQLISDFTMNVLFIQYDTGYRPENIVDGFLVNAMFPQGTGNAGYQRTPGEVTVPDRTVSYYGILQRNTRTVRLAKKIATILAIHTVDYDEAKPTEEDIPGNLIDKGLQQEIKESVRDFVAS